MSERSRVDGQPAFVLHTHPFRETSLIIEVFSRDFGRLALLARGARRPRAALRGLLMSFQPLELDWAGKGEVPNLMKAEWVGGQPLLSGSALFCGYYLNELMMQLLPREDAHPGLFTAYAETLAGLAAQPDPADLEATLRLFEKALLQEIGYGLTFAHDMAGEPIFAEALYTYRMEHGAVRLAPGEEDAAPAISGQTLLDLGRGALTEPRARNEAKALMRQLLAYHLAGRELATRKIFKELQEL
ncbi:MAG: DNA repair protein RecO [Betaproteobacteria bacterium]|nr:DNA repair protein RecO [Betaproteobacteria bacterium]